MFNKMIIKKLKVREIFEMRESAKRSLASRCALCECAYCIFIMCIKEAGSVKLEVTLERSLYARH